MTPQALNRPVDEVFASIWRDGLTRENVSDFEKARAAVADLISAAKEARHVIRLDRASLYSCHYDPKAGDVVDAPGIAGLREYDNALAMLDTALAAIGSQS